MRSERTTLEPRVSRPRALAGGSVPASWLPHAKEAARAIRLWRRSLLAAQAFSRHADLSESLSVIVHKAA